ncbi:MAG: BON domain-containing protein [Acetobacteraceae bacterium]
MTSSAFRSSSGTNSWASSAAPTWCRPSPSTGRLRPRPRRPTGRSRGSHAQLCRAAWGKQAELNIVVSHGVVHLWGLVDTEEARAALRVAAETTPGVKQVQDHTCIPVYN